MNYRFLAVLISSLALLPVHLSGESSPRQLSLGEAFYLVEENNFTILLNREVIEQALSAVQRERSFLLPAVDAELTQTRSRFAGGGGRSSDAFIPAEGGASDGFTSNRFEAGLTGRVSLLDPQRIASFQASKVDLEVAELGFTEIRQEVYAAVARAFLDWQLDLERADVFRANVERSESFLELAVNRVEAGVAPQIDRTRAEVQLARDEQALLEQESVVFSRETELKRLLGLPLTEPLELTPFRSRPMQASMVYREILPALYRDRAEYQTLERTLARNEIEVRAARYERLPSVSLFGNLGWVSETAFDGDETSVWGVGIGVSAPVFEGFRIRSNVLLANSRLRSTVTRLKELEESIAAEFLIVLRNLESRIAQIEVAQKNLELSEEELRLAEVRFAQGVADNRDLVDAQNNVAQAGDNLLLALSRYDQSRLELARIRGDVRLLLADQMVDENSD